MSINEKSLGSFAVVHKKHKGQMYVTTARIVFITQDKKQVSIRRDLITDCKGSRSNVSKAQVVTSTQGYVFTFVDEPVDKHRNKFRDLILRLVAEKAAESGAAAAAAAAAAVAPQASSMRSAAAGAVVSSVRPPAGAVPTEAQARAALLARDAKLRKIYDDVVEKGLVADDEFWSRRRHLLESEMRSDSHQQVGLSTAMLTEVAPEVGGNTVSYTLNANTISQIFAKFPAVLRAYKDNVPDKLTETQFWTKYFRSQYFHRGSGQSDVVGDPKEDIFSRYERDEDRAVASSSSSGGGGSSSTADRRKADVSVHRLVDLSLDESRELDSFARQQHLLGAADHVKTSRALHKAHLLQSYNQHAHTVLKSASAAASSSSSSTAASAAQYHRQLHDSLRLRDLEQPREAQLHELRIQNPELFFGSVANVSAYDADQHRREQLQRAYQDLDAQLHASLNQGGGIAVDACSHFGHTQLVQRLTAECSAAERTRRAATVDKLMLFGKNGKPDEVIPSKLLSVVRERSVRCAELLRHFWACFPVLTADAAARLARCNDALSQQHDEILNLRSKLHAKKFSNFVPLLDPVMRSLEKAFARMQRHSAGRSAAAAAAAAAATGSAIHPAAKRRRVGA